MTKKLLTACLTLMLVAGDAYADKDCDDPISQWKPQGKLRRMLEGNQWNIRRIKVDDGCYEVYGVDRLGNRFEAKYSPASLQLRSLEIEFKGDGGNIADYLDRNASPKDDVPNSANAGRFRHGRAEKSATDNHE